MTISDSLPGIDPAPVTAFVASHVAGVEPPLEFALISGGRSNLTYQVTDARGRTLVLRRPPVGKVLPTAHDMVREYRVLAALQGTDVPVPRVYALCDDAAVSGAPFYVMERCEGVIAYDAWPEGYVDSLADRRAIGTGQVEALARLHAVDIDAVGLGSLAPREGYLERQVRRWTVQWERTRVEEVPELDELTRRLLAALPPSPPTTIVHGDYRIGNMILDANEPGRVVAILDWEMATLGDPLADLGYALGLWGDIGDDPELADARPSRVLTSMPGFHTRAELVAAYAARTGRDVSHIEFYELLAFYKSAVVAAGIHSRYLLGQTVGEGFDTYAHRVRRTARLALELAAKASDPRLRGEG